MSTTGFKFVSVATILALGVIGSATFAFKLAHAASVTATATQPVAAADWELEDVDGKLVKLSDFKGKVVVLDFWATWCGPCRMEIPGFVELQKQYADQGLVVIGVALDDEGAKAVKPFMKQLGINYSIVLGNQNVIHDYGGVEAIPTTFVINRKGIIVEKHLGYADKQQFEKEIKPLLEK